MSDSTGQAGKDRLMTPSNVITITRILLVPVFVAALLAPWPEWFGLSDLVSENVKAIFAGAIFVIISCTDWLDGYLARSRNEVTTFGKFMDPLADKILVTAALIALVELGSLPTWVVLIIIAREFIVSGVRMMAASEGVVIAASMLGKFKTVFQMIAIVLFTIKPSYMHAGFDAAITDSLWLFSWAIMLIALGLTIASMIDYLYKARDLIGLGSKRNESKNASDNLASLEGQVIERALASGKTIATAESLTGGLIGSALTSVPGSSEAYLGGVVSYTNGVKQGVLDVPESDLAQHGAVSREVACAMAEGARKRTGADLSVSVTGIAGPGGAEPGKPVGTVWMGISDDNGTTAEMFSFQGDRASVRTQTVKAALEALLERL